MSWSSSGKLTSENAPPQISKRAAGAKSESTNFLVGVVNYIASILSKFWLISRHVWGCIPSQKISPRGAGGRFGNARRIFFRSNVLFFLMDQIALFGAAGPAAQIDRQKARKPDFFFGSRLNLIGPKQRCFFLVCLSPSSSTEASVPDSLRFGVREEEVSLGWCARMYRSAEM